MTVQVCIYNVGNFCDQSIRSPKLIDIVILWVYYTIPFGFSLFWHFFCHYFWTFYTTCLAKDHWRGFSTRNAHIVHIVNLFRLKKNPDLQTTIFCIGGCITYVIHVELSNYTCQTPLSRPRRVSRMYQCKVQWAELTI